MIICNKCNLPFSTSISVGNGCEVCECELEEWVIAQEAYNNKLITCIKCGQVAKGKDFIIPDSQDAKCPNCGHTEKTIAIG